MVEAVVIVDETQTMYDLDVETVDTFAVGELVVCPGFRLGDQRASGGVGGNCWGFVAEGGSL